VFADDIELNACCNLTLMTQSTDGQEEGPRVTNSGRVSWVADSFTLTLERSLREGVAEDVGDCTRVSEIEI
jgi:hypothetical protein